MKKEKITIEQLAIMINNGFKEAKKDLKDEVKSVNQKLDTQGERLEFLIDTSKRQFDDITDRFNTLETRTENIGKNMVTKTYFDGQIKDLKGEIVLKIQKQDGKFNLLVEILYNKDILFKKDVAIIDSLNVSSKK